MRRPNPWPYRCRIALTLALGAVGGLVLGWGYTTAVEGVVRASGYQMER